MPTPSRDALANSPHAASLRAHLQSDSRRRWLGSAGCQLLAAGAVGGRTNWAYAAAAPSATLHGTQVISRLTHRYHGWPTLAQRPDGELLVVCSGGRESHVCPFGRVELIRSKDQGKTWSWPRVVIDGPIDDRDAGMVVTAKGTLLVTTFTSLAYETPLAAMAEDDPRRPAWLAAHQRLTDHQRTAELGVWMIRSTDGGIHWSAPARCLVNSPHGPFSLGDGRLLYAGKELWKKPSRIGVCQSADDGKSWSWLSEIPTRPGDRAEDYHELHGVEAADGRVLVQIRNHNSANARETLQTESADGGKTWSVPHPIGVWGLPSHLLRLRSGRLLMSYGHRRPPFGNQARISDDHGRTWSQPVTISADGIGGDLGYPSTVELADGSLLTVWYERLKDSPRAVLRQAHWSLAE